jgi:hypothetical protein
MCRVLFVFSYDLTITNLVIIFFADYMYVSNLKIVFYHTWIILI